MSARPSSDTQTRSYEIAIVGNDMLLAALPGRAVQLAHAILAAGYDLVVPVSWGEELLAEHVLRELGRAPSHAMVFCACPLVRQRLLASGNEIVPHLLSTVPPPVATARYLRALQPDVAMRITYLGSCPGAVEHSIDAQLQPQDLLRHLEQRAISVVRQPVVFESIVPPDRRRHWSVPGGAPSVDAMLARGLAARFVTVGPDVALEIAEAILAAERVLLDVAPAQGCACAGYVEVHQVEGSREAVIALEPPRSHLPVIDVEPRIAVAQPMPHLTGSSSVRMLRTASTPRATPNPVTSIHDAARGRSERGRIAITPPHISTTPQRVRTAGPSNEPASASHPARRADLRMEVPPAHDERASASPPTERTRAEPVTPPVEGAPAREATDVAPGTAPGVPVNEEGVGVPATIAVRRRTPSYEMRHVARSRASHTGEAARVPRAYGAVRSRARGDVASPMEPPGREGPSSIEVSTAIPVVVDGPADAPVHAPVRPAPEGDPRATLLAPRLERREAAAPIPGRSWLLVLVLVVVVGAVVCLLLPR